MCHLACKVVLYFEYIFITVLLKQSLYGCIGSVAGSDDVICSCRRCFRGCEIESRIGLYNLSVFHGILGIYSLSLSLSLVYHR